MKKCTPLLAGVLSAFAGFSQTVIDGFDYPIGDHGYDSLGNEYAIPEQINPDTYTVPGYTDIEINQMYPDWISATPNRGSNTIIGWHNDSDVGDWSPGGIHPGSGDENFGAAGDDIGFPIGLTAHGTFWDIRRLSVDVTKSGWCLVFLHIMPTGDSTYSLYGHVTSATNVDGTVCLNESDFGLTIGQEYSRGTIIARIGNVTSFGSHLHFEMRSHFNKDLGLWPNGPGGRYPEKSDAYQYSMTMEKVAQAYYEMQLDGILDASDFIDQHRPSLYAETPCYDPPIAWQNTIGGSGSDRVYSMDGTLDGGYILAGSSYSNISGDKTENTIGETLQSDYWVIKLDSLSNIEWQNTLGGNANDIATSIAQTIDGGYIVGGTSPSSISGDKTENSDASDYWILRLDNLGNIIWQNTIGGDFGEYGTVVRETFDGGYLVGGYSDSNISGDKTENRIGTGPDYWIVKLDSLGNVMWDNTIGGSASDELRSLEETTDGGYIIAGSSYSNISGDKTENCFGIDDYWVLKLDPIGNIEWQNTLGGSGTDYLTSIKQTSDGAYILGGSSESNISGDKSENIIGLPDYWIVKLSSTGEIEWDNTIGGTGDDVLWSLIQTTDEGFAGVGYSVSNISGDKTENNQGGSYDYWLVKLDNGGVVEWDNTIGGSSWDEPLSIVETFDGGYAIAGSSNSGLSGDKTETTQGNYDYWIVNLSCEVPCDPETIAISASGPTTFCQGGSVNLNATYSGATVQWKKDGIDILGATSSMYTVTQKGAYTATTTGDCGSTNSNEIVVVVQKNPVAGIIAGGPTTFCSGGSVVLTANAGAGLSYQWYKGATPIAGATSINYTATLAGSYRCQVTKVSTGCSKLSTAISVSVPCKVGLSDMNEVFVYPNPTSEVFYVQTDESVCTVAVVNMVGQIVYQNSVYQNEAISVQGWPSGIYLVTLSSDQGTKTIQFVVE